MPRHGGMNVVSVQRYTSMARSTVTSRSGRWHQRRAHVGHHVHLAFHAVMWNQGRTQRDVVVARVRCRRAATRSSLSDSWVISAALAVPVCRSVCNKRCRSAPVGLRLQLGSGAQQVEQRLVPAALAALLSRNEGGAEGRSSAGSAVGRQHHGLQLRLRADGLHHVPGSMVVTRARARSLDHATARRLVHRFRQTAMRLRAGCHSTRWRTGASSPGRSHAIARRNAAPAGTGKAPRRIQLSEADRRP